MILALTPIFCNLIKNEKSSSNQINPKYYLPDSLQVVIAKERSE